MKYSVYIIDKLFDTSPIFFNEFKDAYSQSLSLLFRNDEKSDFEIYVEKISITLLSKRNLSKEYDVVLCLADTTSLDKSLIYIPFLDESKDVENNQFPHRKLEELVNMMNIESQYFKELKMRRFLRLTKNLKMSSMYSWINIKNKINEPEFVYPLYCLLSSLDLQRIEDGIMILRG